MSKLHDQHGHFADPTIFGPTRVQLPYTLNIATLLVSTTLRSLPLTVHCTYPTLAACRSAAIFVSRALTRPRKEGPAVSQQHTTQQYYGITCIASDHVKFFNTGVMACDAAMRASAAHPWSGHLMRRTLR